MAVLSAQRTGCCGRRQVDCSSVVEVRDRRRWVLHQDGVEPGALGADDVAGAVVEEHRLLRRHIAEQGEGVVVDGRVGLAHADLGAVHHDVEQLVDGDQRAPHRRALAHVVGDEPEPVAVRAQGAHPIEDRLVEGHVAEHRAQRREVDLDPLLAAGLRDRGGPVGDGHLASLHLVPRVVGVLLVGPDQQLEVPAAGGGERDPGRRRQHAREVEEHRRDRAHPR